MRIGVLLCVPMIAMAAFRTPGIAQTRRNCVVPQLRPTDVRQMVFREIGDSGYLTEPPMGSPITPQVVPVSFRDQCYLFFAISAGDPFFGLLAVTDDHLKVLWSDTTRRQPANLLVTARGRPVFIYNSEWGSGWWEDRAIALCPLGPQVWVDCVDIVINKRVSVRPGDWGDYQQEGWLTVTGDTLCLKRSIVRFYSQPGPPPDTVLVAGTRYVVP
jgi:hypothetical protein